jgi:hypothetical protein
VPVSLEWWLERLAKRHEHCVYLKIKQSEKTIVIGGNINLRAVNVFTVALRAASDRRQRQGTLKSMSSSESALVNLAQGIN